MVLQESEGKARAGPAAAPATRGCTSHRASTAASRGPWRPTRAGRAGRPNAAGLDRHARRQPADIGRRDSIPTTPAHGHVSPRAQGAARHARPPRRAAPGSPGNRAAASQPSGLRSLTWARRGLTLDASDSTSPRQEHRPMASRRRALGGLSRPGTLRLPRGAIEIAPGCQAVGSRIVHEISRRESVHRANRPARSPIMNTVCRPEWLPSTVAEDIAARPTAAAGNLRHAAVAGIVVPHRRCERGRLDAV
jgi:hypothetical protein